MPDTHLNETRCAASALSRRPAREVRLGAAAPRDRHGHRPLLRREGRGGHAAQVRDAEARGLARALA